jgi:hypothetical protein
MAKAAVQGLNAKNSVKFIVSAPGKKFPAE